MQVLEIAGQFLAADLKFTIFASCRSGLCTDEVSLSLTRVRGWQGPQSLRNPAISAHKVSIDPPVGPFQATTSQRKSTVSESPEGAGCQTGNKLYTP
jgi:hypothetical protein